ncbi:MAG TPA: hypothetical protein VG838_01710 [Opitutaceae bacterium]|nr:hypothetical protein [Opitutaceae bacterium]
MKNIIYAIAALSAAAGLRAEEPKSDYSITADFTYASEYIFRGVENAQNSFQPSVEFTKGDFNLDLWTNQPVTRHENNEIDLSGSYGYKVSNALKLEGVVTSYNYPEAGRGATKDSIEGGLGATYTIAGLSPSLYYYHDFRLNSDTVQGAVGYSLPLEAIGASVDTSIYAGTVNTRDTAPDSSAAAVQDAYNYYGVDVSVPYKLNKNATWTVAVHYAENQNLAGVGGPFGTLGRRNLWVTTGITIGF